MKWILNLKNNKIMIISIIFVLSLFLLFIGFKKYNKVRTNPNADLNKIISKIKDKVEEIPSNMLYNDETIEIFYSGIEEKIERYAGFSPMMDSSIEVVIFKVKENEIENVKDIISKRKENQSYTFKESISEQYEIINNSEIKVLGNYVYFVSMRSEDRENVIKLIEKGLK